MNTSISVSSLKEHRNLLSNELEEVKILMSILEELRMQDDGISVDNAAFLAGQISYLENQKKWITNRLNIIDVLIGEFTRFQFKSQEIWNASRYVIQALDE